MLLDKIRMSPADFLIDEAVLHFSRTGNSVKGFIVPPAMWLELKADSEVLQTSLSYMLDVEGFHVIASEKMPPMLIEDNNPQGVPLL